VRQSKEHHVVAGQHIDVGGVERPACQRKQVWMVLGKGRACAGRCGQRADGQPPVGVGRMAEEQPEDLSTGISAGTGDRDRRHAAILHGYAGCCKLIYVPGIEGIGGMSSISVIEPSPGIVSPGMASGTTTMRIPSVSRMAAVP
jgi:hypothetical protein